MTLVEQLWQAVPGLQSAIVRQPLVQDREQAWVLLRQLMLAHAPTAGVTLPGAIFDQVTDIAASFGLADRLGPHLAGTGNPGLWVGVEKEWADLVVVAHLDRPTFRVSMLHGPHTATLSPVDGPGGAFTSSAARALRYDPDARKLRVVAQGRVRLVEGAAPSALLFETDSGAVSALDMILLELPPVREGALVHGSGLDNCAGVLAALGAAAILREVEEVLVEQNRRCLFVFSGRQSVLPGAVGLRGSASAAVPPSLGMVLVDVLTVGHGTPVSLGEGTCFTFAEEREGGLLVPPHYRRLTQDLAQALVGWPLSVEARRFQGMPSHSQCSASHPAQIVSLTGPPIQTTPSGGETMHLGDLQTAVKWLACLLPIVLNLVPAITVRYALGHQVG